MLPTFLRKKVHPGHLAGGYSDLEMTWLLYCAGAATGQYADILAKTLQYLSEPVIHQSQQHNVRLHLATGLSCYTRDEVQKK